MAVSPNRLKAIAPYKPKKGQPALNQSSRSGCQSLKQDFDGGSEGCYPPLNAVTVQPGPVVRRATPEPAPCRCPSGMECGLTSRCHSSQNRLPGGRRSDTRMKSLSTVLAASLFALAAPAQADQPVCPCWETIDDLAWIVNFGGDEIDDCDTVPQATVLRTFEPPQVRQQSTIHTKRSRLVAITRWRAQGDVLSQQCYIPGPTRTTPPAAIDVTRREFWTCTNILRAFCKSQGF
jgi:hypothetical protein